MHQRGRKSAASNLVQQTEAQPRLSPPPNLTNEERALFNEIVNATAPTHFVKSDTLLLVSLVQATLLARRAATAMHRDADEVVIFEKAIKLQGMLATR